MLTPALKTLVQESFATSAPIADDAAALFQRRLFEIDPALEIEKGLGEAFTPEAREACGDGLQPARVDDAAGGARGAAFA